VLDLFLRNAPQAEEPIGKPLVVVLALGAAIAGLELIGFAPAVFLLLLVLFAVVERLPLVRSILVAAGTTAVLFLIFRTWLGVTLPVGPLGI
jgi:apolipoprotein N-acyltransferase